MSLLGFLYTAILVGASARATVSQTAPPMAPRDRRPANGGQKQQKLQQPAAVLHKQLKVPLNREQVAEVRLAKGRLLHKQLKVPLNREQSSSKHRTTK
jgi:hypothetical protein